MPAVIERKATAFYGVRSSYDEHVKARSSKTSGYYETRKAMLDGGAIDKEEFDASLVPYTEAEWIDEQGSLDGPIILVATSGFDVVARNDVDEKGKVIVIEDEVPYDERDVMSGPFPWVEITIDEYNAAQGEEQDNNGNNGKAAK